MKSWLFVTLVFVVVALGFAFSNSMNSESIWDDFRSSIANDDVEETAFFAEETPEELEELFFQDTLELLEFDDLRITIPYSCDDPKLVNGFTEVLGAGTTVVDTPGNNPNYVLNCQVYLNGDKTITFTLEDFETMANAKSNYNSGKSNNGNAVQNGIIRKSGLGVLSEAALENQGRAGKTQVHFHRY